LLPACGPFGQSSDHTFYVSPSGSDSADGTSPQTAWRTLSRASSATLRPGDRLLLQGGHRFTGQLRLGPEDAGNPRKPVYIGSYNTGRAVIAGTAAAGILVVDTAGVDIRHVVLAGAHRGGPQSAGIQLYSDLPRNHHLDHVVIEDVDVSGFGTGISIGAVNPGAGFHGVWVGDSALHDNLSAGLSSYGPKFDPAAPSYAHANVHVARVQAYGNAGDPASTHRNSGNGIVLGSVSDASVSWSTAHGNGGANGAPHEGPIGIWAYDSTGVVIQHSLSFGNQTATRRDGGGFGLDQNTSNSVLQYNLAYGNAGAGFQVYSPRDKQSQGNIVRFNISSGDALETINAAGIIVSGRVIDAAVYQNTVIIGDRSAGPHAALWLGKSVRGITVRNNIFMTTSPAAIVVAQHALKPATAMLQGNDYFTTASHLTVLWGLSAPYQSLPSWRAATGQEIVRGRPAGIAADPRLRGPVLGLTSRAATDPGNGAGFVPVSGSPVLRAGLDLSRLFHTDPGRVGYGGQPVSQGRPNIGAH